MKISSILFAATAVAVLTTGAVAETVHQSVPGDQVSTGDGGNAVEKGQVEVKKVDGASNGQVARVKGSMGQWGYVNYWFGIPAPVGKSVVRLRIYCDGQKTAKYALYMHGKSDQVWLSELKIPADVKTNSFVTVDVPANATAEWGGLTIKKTEASDAPSPWIDTVSTILPE
jgi:hypothetical protein